MSNVIHLDMLTTVKLPSIRILEAAIEEDLDDVVVIGWTKDGELYAASTGGKISDNLFLLEMAKDFLKEQIS